MKSQEQYEEEELIEDFIDLLLDILDIDEPIITCKPKSFFATETMNACCNIATDEIFIKDTISLADLLLCLAHEMRHIWQQTHKPQFQKEYKFRTKEGTIDDYNMQEAEIDAHAFSSILVERFIGAKPTFDGVGERVCKKIEEHIRILEKELPTAEEMSALLEKIKEFYKSGEL